MTADYFNEQIHEELEGAECYAKKAIELRAQNVSWAKMFYEMSLAELTHATNLYEMFEEYYSMLLKNYREAPDYVEDIHKHLTDLIADCGAKVKHMYDIFNK